ncbi:hypothetical protein CTI12_AA018840 [Artemisia annua]|uniref:Retrotransposon Copia-like N-terminal domain-containing protein n=1 Tax=Artemisia annua TaxID=35608 RepID=A0A2U1Q7P4_ARTAN|nr:hypothetical protein CTI12_AA018840 [Artemisia annua]
MTEHGIFKNPLYEHHSDSPNSLTVQENLNGAQNYRAWRRAIEIGLSTKRKIRLIKGTILRSATDANLVELWDTCNNMRSQILIIVPLPSVENAYSMLQQEESQRALFGSNAIESTALLSKGKCQENQTPIITFTPNTDSNSYNGSVSNTGSFPSSNTVNPNIVPSASQPPQPPPLPIRSSSRQTTLPTKLKEFILTCTPKANQIKCVWEGLDSINVFRLIPEVSQEVLVFLVALSKQKEDQRLFQFLNGFDDHYRNQRSQILIIVPLPSVENAYSMLQQEESQKHCLDLMQLNQLHCLAKENFKKRLGNQTDDRIGQSPIITFTPNTDSNSYNGSVSNTAPNIGSFPSSNTVNPNIVPSTSQPPQPPPLPIRSSSRQTTLPTKLKEFILTCTPKVVTDDTFTTHFNVQLLD